MAQVIRRVDHSALKTNQAVIIILLLAAFMLNFYWLAAVVSLFMLVGTIVKRPGFAFLYTRVLRPLKLLNSDVIQDNPEPHRFAQGFGGVVLLGSVVAFLLGASTVGWALVWLVIALAALNLFVGFCAGCAVYYWLNRLKVPGFVQSPPAGTFPGMRPKARA